ncbi:MAG: peptidase C11 [Clostridiaceae bacterium]|nr:peptidase C11 [Clostridiaceae bacterium]
MARGNRPVSRQKRVGSGSATVRRRSGTSGRGSSRPVGGGGGYFQRSTTSSGSRGPVKKMSLLKLLVPIIVIGIMIYIGSKMGGGSGITSPVPGNDNGGFNIGDNGGSSEQISDSGSYAVDRSVSEQARPKLTALAGSGQDQVTIMVYLLGTDLESRSGMATMDLQEMLAADLSDNVNIVLETGGTAKWKNDQISSNTNQRYLIDSDGLKLLEADLGKKSMVDPANLTNFIKYSEEKFPADRYMFIFWDHGGGSVTGYGYDEHFKGDTMTLAEIGTALSGADCKFDIVGFDACLMATLETAFVVEPYADYLIASEELEPGIGWYYTGWLNTLSQNSSIATIDLGKKLIDDYIQEVKRKVPRSQATLSLVDLAELKGIVPESFGDFAEATGKLIKSDDYKIVADSRAGTKEFAASSKINQIDLVDFAKRLGTKEALAFADVLDQAVKYNRMSDNITNANGLSIYFPYGKLNTVSSMVDTYEKIDMDENYTEAIKNFANLNIGGQMASQGGGLLDVLLGAGQGTSSPSQGISGNVISSLLGNFLSQGNFSSLLGGDGQAPSWLNTHQITDSSQYYSENMLDPASIKLSQKNGQRVLQLSEKEWGLVHSIELNVFIDDGEGYIDLGRDNVFEFNDDGDLIVEFDGTWLTLNGQVVSYFMSSYDVKGEDYTIMGRVPALLNGQRVDIVVSFSQDDPYGSVLGANVIYDENAETPNQAKGLVEIKAGDKIDYLCDYYSYEGAFNDSYLLGDQYIATGSWRIENLELTNTEYLMSFKLTDIYDNSYWTPAVTD